MILKPYPKGYVYIQLVLILTAWHSYSWNLCFQEDIRMVHFIDFFFWALVYLRPSLLLSHMNDKLVCSEKCSHGGESDLLTLLPAIHDCAGLDDREGGFKGVIFNPTSSTPTSMEISPHPGPWCALLSNAQWRPQVPYSCVPSQVFQGVVQGGSTK